MAAKRLLLVGGGHAHALVLRQWVDAPLAGVELTLITPEPGVPYTGMLPGRVAGHFSDDDMHYDARALVRAAGGQFVPGRVVGLDAERGTARTEAGANHDFDLISLDIGVSSGSQGKADAVRVKPIGQFLDAWERFCVDVRAGQRTPRVGVVGGGLGGVELAMAMQHRLSGFAEPNITIFDAEDTALSAEADGLRKHLLRALETRRITVRSAARVQSVEANTLTLSSGESLPADFVVFAAGAHPAPWLPETGLDCVDGFVSVGPTLRSVSSDAVFAAGDIAHLSHAPRPKAGVFAVRAAPVLAHNLRAALTGAPLKPFQPQTDYLKLVTLGDTSAVAEKWGFALALPGLWALKRRLDQSFMRKLRVQPVEP